MTDERSAKNAGIISIIANISLTVTKVGIGLWAGSEVLLSDGIHSAIDIVASIASLGTLSIAYRPPDENHPYGHGKAEDLAASIVSLILIGVGCYIVVSSIRELFRPTHDIGQLPLYIAIMSLVIKEGLFRYTDRLGRKLNSPALVALAQDHRSDIWGSWAAVIGIGISIVGYKTGHTDLAYADPIGAILVGVLIVKTSISVGNISIRALMEHNVSAETLEKYESLVRCVPEVRRIDRIRARHLGHYVLVDLRVSIHGRMTVQEGHDISRKIKGLIIEKHPEVKEVLIHFNPYYDAE